jgi:hypothetical protein
MDPEAVSTYNFLQPLSERGSNLRRKAFHSCLQSID